MKVVKLLAVTCAFCASSAYAVDPVLSETTCDQLAEKYEPTAEAQARYADLKGSCDSVHTINGALYVKAKAVIRRVRNNEITLYLPATDHTFKVNPDPDGRVLVGNRKVRPRELNRGDEISIYLSVDKIATERLDTVALATEDDHADEVVETAVEEVETLPTTG